MHAEHESADLLATLQRELTALRAQVDRIDREVTTQRVQLAQAHAACVEAQAELAQTRAETARVRRETARARRELAHFRQVLVPIEVPGN